MLPDINTQQRYQWCTFREKGILRARTIIYACSSQLEIKTQCNTPPHTKHFNIFILWLIQDKLNWWPDSKWFQRKSSWILYRKPATVNEGTRLIFSQENGGLPNISVRLEGRIYFTYHPSWALHGRSFGVDLLHQSFQRTKLFINGAS